MIALGLVLIVVGLAVSLPPVLYVGFGLLVLGLVLLALGQSGRRVGGRRHYF